MIRPSFLQPGDKVALVAPAKVIDKASMDIPKRILHSWGLTVVEGAHLYDSWNQFAGTDGNRKLDLQWSLDAEDIKAVFCARGGYGASRIIDDIDFTRFKKNPKWVIGFSDITLLLTEIFNLGIETIHGLMPMAFSNKDYHASVENLKKLLFGILPEYHLPPSDVNLSGTAEAEIIGGNLTILHTIIQTPSFPGIDGKILFLEEIGEYLYHIDRVMVHFKRTGLLNKLAGVVVGHFSDIKDGTTPFGKNAYEIIREHLAEYSIPVAFHFPAGHEAPNFPIVFGSRVRLEVTSQAVSLKYSSGDLNT